MPPPYARAECRECGAEVVLKHLGRHQFSEACWLRKAQNSEREILRVPDSVLRVIGKAIKGSTCPSAAAEVPYARVLFRDSNGAVLVKFDTAAGRRRGLRLIRASLDAEFAIPRVRAQVLDAAVRWFEREMAAEATYVHPQVRAHAREESQDD